MAEASFRLPPPLDVHDPSISESFKRWKRQLEVYMVASGASAKSKEVQKAVILHCAGNEIIDASVHFPWKKPDGTNMSEDEKKDPKNLMKMIEDYCNPRQSEVLMSHRFWNIPWTTPFDTFLTELRTRADACNFRERDRMIRDKIVFSAKGKVQELLLRDATLDLPKAIDICRAYEQSLQQIKEMNDVKNIDRIERVSTNQHNVKKATGKPKFSGKFNVKKYEQPFQNKMSNPNVNDCNFCGGSHEKLKFKCPAWGQSCSNCKGRNHFSKKCKKPKVHSVEGNEIETSQESDEDTKWLAAVKTGREERIYAKMNVNGCTVQFQVDCGANVNIICQKYVKRSQVTEPKCKLYMWNNTQQKVLGEAILKVYNPGTKKEHEVNFSVVENNLQPLLGARMSQEMDLITVNQENFIASVSQSDLGDLGEASLVVDPAIPPKALPCKNVPFPIQEEVKKELENLMKREILIPVDEPTRWVSQMAVVRKANGKLRICIDPQALNRALQREHYKLPTLDDVLPKMLNAKVFSKIDIKEAFWHIRLDEESSKLTTMITPLGRFRWARLPFGLKVSSEVFQKRLHHAICDLKGVICVADDIVVVGCGKTQVEAELDHKKNLDSLINRCSQAKIKINKEKMAVKKNEIEFMGHTISSEGIKASKEKVRAIQEMPAPEDISGVRRLCGMIQYLARYTPNLASDLEPIHALTRKDVPFEWSDKCQQAFNALKNKLCNSPVLVFYDNKKPLVLQADSSEGGLGAVLLQDGLPIEYASRALRSNERKWSQIEKEALAVVYGLEKFDQYTFGRTVIINNDHKPLETILRKPLSQATRRIQSLMMRMFRYDFEFEWMKGAELHVADTLSRAYPKVQEELPDLRILSVEAINIPDHRMEEIRQATAQDSQFQVLCKYIMEGWPEVRQEIPEELKQYFDIRDTLTVEDGIVYKGERIVVPVKLRPEIKKRLHAAHLGLESMMRRARGLIFWPGMAREISQLVENCLPCQEHKPANQKETLIIHDKANQPWEKIGCDLFSLMNRDYFVVVDYKSNFIEVEYMTSTTSRKVVNVLEKLCARYGRPKVLISDGGPQFISKEFQNFTTEWGIQHNLSSPYHSQSNGKAEAAVKTIKGMMKKCLQENSNQYLALLELRNTPRQDTASPAQIMYGRTLNTQLPRKEGAECTNQVQKMKRQMTVKKYYDKTAKNLCDLQPNQPVGWKSGPTDDKWKRGQVLSRTGDRSYIIQGENGGLYTRNRVDLRPSTIPFELKSELDITVPTNVPPSTVPVMPNTPVKSPVRIPDIPPVERVRPKRSVVRPKRFDDFDISGWK